MLPQYQDVCVCMCVNTYFLYLYIYIYMMSYMLADTGFHVNATTTTTNRAATPG